MREPCHSRHMQIELHELDHIVKVAGPILITIAFIVSDKIRGIKH